MSALQTESWSGIIPKLTYIDNWKIIRILGRGLTAECYDVRNTMDKTNYAMKIATTDKKSILNKEMQYISILNTIPSPYFVKSWGKQIHIDTSHKWCYFIMGLESETNWSTFQKEAQFGIFTSCKLILELFYIIEDLHSRGLVHGDLKPSNVVFKKEPLWNYHAVLIDYEKVSKKGTTEGVFIGCSTYASIDIHQFQPYSVRDDMTSIYYIFQNFYQKKLPWDPLLIQMKKLRKQQKEESKQQKEESKAIKKQIKAVKQQILDHKKDLNKWLKDRPSEYKYDLPSIFKDIFRIINEDKNDCNYYKLRRIIREHMKQIKPQNKLKFIF